MIQDFLLCDRKLRLKYYFHKDEEEIENPDELEDRDMIETLHMKTFYIQAQDGHLQSGQDPYLDAYRSLTLKKILENIKKPTKHYKPNLKKDEITAISTLKNNRNIIIKPADKGRAIVITNREYYIKEGLRQLENNCHYESLDKDPTKYIMKK